MRYIRLTLWLVSLLVMVTSCGTAKLKTADEQMARGEYFDAAKTYRKVYNKLKAREQRAERGVVAFRMAECYRALGQDARAAAAYQNAIRYGYPDSTAILRMAQCLHGDGKYDRAIKTYEEFLALAPDNATAANG
ncbi:MAG: tetratricopeptide repeat protein, partial [Duncaniella sp.]|nr:tetratricopeptide repeat protein [Duncaniella sp.]